MPSRKETIKIQKALGRAGYFKGSPTGFYGKRTRAAVKSFQKAKGLAADGMVGTVTWKKLKRYL
jgi:peptidoglycan hydrolase-like protein with peptidoglycan-binding domain